MRITIPKVVTRVDLGEYAPELAGKFLHVWVNMPRETLQEYDDLVTSMQEKTLAKASESAEHGASSVEREAKGFGALLVQVGAMLKRKRESSAEGIDVRLLAWYARMWSQGPQDAAWTLEELQEIEQQDPSFLSWCIARSWAERNEHISRKKKN